MNFLKRIPIALSGLMLATASLGNLLAVYSPVARMVCGALAIVMWAFIAGRMIVFSKQTLEDLSNPVILSVAPRYAMGTMVVATNFAPYSLLAGQAVWLVGFALHVMILALFVLKVLAPFDIKKLYPSAFVPFVGIAVAGVTAPAVQMIKSGQNTFWFGLAALIVLLPVLLYRFFVVKDIPEPVLPTTAIFAAPTSLVLAAYLACFSAPNVLAVHAMAIVALILYVGVLAYMPKMLRLPFYPTYASFTFPLVISAVAITMTQKFLLAQDLHCPAVPYIVAGEQAIAIAIVVYVLIRYTMYLVTSSK